MGATVRGKSGEKTADCKLVKEGDDCIVWLLAHMELAKSSLHMKRGDLEKRGVKRCDNAED